MSSIGHSTGLLLLDGSTVADNDTYSFRVDSSGLEEFLGWGMSASYPPLDINPPEGAVHVVYVGVLDDASKTAIRELAGEHVLRYGECRIYTYPEIGPIAAWIAAGSPDPSDEDQTAVAADILANQQGPLTNPPEASPVANSEIPGTDVGFVPDTATSGTSTAGSPGEVATSAPVATGHDEWATEGTSGITTPPADDNAGPQDNTAPEAVSVNPEADAQPGQATGENVAGEPASNPTKRDLPDT